MRTMQKRAAGFLLTTFQKLNASSTAAIRSALQSRLVRLKGDVAELPPDEEKEPEFFDERYEGEHEEEKAGLFLSERELIEDEIATLERLLSNKVKRDKKLDELLTLIDHIAVESARSDEEKVLIFTEYRQTQAYLVSELEKKYGKARAMTMLGRKIARAVYQMLKRKEPFDAVKFFAC